MGKYLLAEDDGLPIREFGDWAKEKIFYVNKYINTVSKAMWKKGWRKINYIELFSGSGKFKIMNKDEIVLGSPLTALTIPFPFTDYYFVEKDINCLANLQTRCSETSIPKESIHFFKGDANTTVKYIVNEILEIDKEKTSGKWQSFNLAFLDPDGLELRWETVQELARVNKMDLIIHYSQQGIRRNADRAIKTENETKIDRFFGDKKWRRIYEGCKNDPTGILRPLIDYYKSKLNALGYVKVQDNEEILVEPLMKNSMNAPLYRLLFASKNPLGLKFWKDNTKVGLDGQLPLWK